MKDGQEYIDDYRYPDQGPADPEQLLPGEAGRRRAVDEFSQETFDRRLGAVIEAVLTQRRRR